MSHTTINPFNPLVSIIIPCYNHGKYLAQAIESILAQEYKRVEIIVVDDGSSDNTRYIAQKFDCVRYIHQTNQGLSAARNTGIDNSSGEYLIFLDADDWLLPGAISKNLYYFNKNKNLAFVSGGYQELNVTRGNVAVIKNPVEGHYYESLLKVNYIGMHAAVTFRRNVFDEIRYDTSLRASEDYDIYLRIARKYPVFHHTDSIAMYRKHESNMSCNIPLMLNYTLLVLNQQRDVLQTPKEKRCLRNGVVFWKKYYASELYTQIRTTYQPLDVKQRSVEALRKFSFLLYVKYLLAEIVNPSKFNGKPALA